MPPKLKRVPPPHGGYCSANAERCEQSVAATLDRPTGGGLPPNDGHKRAGAVNIDRRLKLTTNDDSCSPSIAITSCDENLAASARSCVVADVSFVETNGSTEQLSNEQLSTYLASLSELEQRVCSIARDHLESSFDLSRSSGFIAWKAKN